MSQKEEQSNGFGIAGFVLSILGILFSFGWGIGIIFSILALIFSLVQRKKYQNGLNIAGFVMSLIGIVISLLMILFLVLFFAILAPSFENIGPSTALQVTEYQENYLNAPLNLVYANLDSNNKNIRVTIRNDGGEDITIKRILTTSGDLQCSTNTKIPMSTGETRSFILSGENCDPWTGITYQTPIEVTYQREGSQLELTSLGIIRERAI